MTKVLLVAPFAVTDGPQRHAVYAELAATGHFGRRATARQLLQTPLECDTPD